MTTSSAAATSTPYYVAALLPADSPHWETGGGVLYSDTLGQAATVSYGFLTSSAGLSADNAAGFAPMAETQKTYIRQALATWSAVANVTFTETGSAASAAIRFATNAQYGVSAGYGYYPSTYSTGGLVLLANDDSNNTRPAPGTYGFMTAVHEVGHALGLKHPGNYDAGGTGTEGPYLPASEDNYAYSIMSYNENAALPSGFNLTQPSIDDVAAIQYLYGANMAAAPGDTTYTLAPTTFTTIWDPNGTNTLDAGAQSAAEVLDLRGGGFSRVGSTLVAGVCFNSRIQGARGGSGADTIYANDLGDTIDGGAGTDTVVFSGASADYTMTNSNGTIVVSRNGVANSLTNVEQLRFSNTTIATSTITGTVTTTSTAGNTVYRFYNTRNGTHFYTSSSTERDTVIRGGGDLVYEGGAFTSIASSASGAASVYRFYNQQVGSHFYTIDATERDRIISTWPGTYTYEGVAYSAYGVGSAGASAAGSTALYRFYNRQQGSHFYTIDTTERDNVINTLSSVYTYEGIAYYVSSGAASASPAHSVALSDPYAASPAAGLGGSGAGGQPLISDHNRFGLVTVAAA